ncbi:MULTISPECIES: hypothetical protein [Microbacterium]|uniref:hypothetical protein n=1 Tax=Microbacterium TaxID=33882 RepID=UPI0027824F58|nr:MULTISPECIES: hypothetical protein [Microbacterium]MDQ1075300.1 hypothetical protein [Microbacterium sp. SORGH_AS_0969]MDQ1115530.1 hypothetical protein [Microbacterium testaceum]
MITPADPSPLLPPDVDRRSVLAGAAWTIPAIAAATLAPMASASTTTTLTFDQTSYSGTVCTDIVGASVTVTVDGVAGPGKSVTATTSTGYHFANGSSTFTGVSDAAGRVTLPRIRVQAGGTTGTLTATAPDATAAATLTSPTSTATQGLHRRTWIDTGAASSSGSTDATVPTGSRAVGTLVTLDPSGVLRRGTSTIASGVTSAFAELEKSNYLSVTWVDASGLHRRMWTDVGAAYPAASVDVTVPAYSVVVGTLITIDSGGTLRKDVTTIATGVSSAFAELDKNNALTLTWTDATGMHRRLWTGTGPSPASNVDASVPAGSIAVGTLLTLGPDAVLRRVTTSVATGVTSVFAELDSGNYTSVTWVDGTGMHRRMWTDTGSAFPAGSVDAAVPADSTAVGTLLTLDASGTLRKGTNTVATGVPSARGEIDKSNSTVVTFVDGTC